MKLYVHLDLPLAARHYLLQHLPPDVEVTFGADLPAAAQQAALHAAQVLLGSPPAAWMAHGGPPALHLWQLESAGFEAYAGLAVAAPVANMGDFFAWPCAETMVTGLLRGRQVVVLGAGAIGQAVRQQLGGFGCVVQLLARTSPEANLHSRAELLAALPTTEVVVNCLPGSADGYVDAELLTALPPGSVYATVGRGSTTDEPALLAALASGHLAGAILDVTATEPLPADHPFWAMPQVLLTQHTGGGQPHELEGRIDQLLRNLARLRAGQPLENLVELGRGY